MKPRPFCRWCGKDLPKRVKIYWVVAVPSEHKVSDDFYGQVKGPIHTREQAQRLVNEQVTAVRYRRPDHANGISRFSTWDGESYKSVGGFFCTNNCAIYMGISACQFHNLAGADYNKRVLAKNKKLPCE